uniref:Uncharacterized protein n=1 Tax=Amphimedon queenslandica TaxID=400682 RepID=A0A1X7T5X8_AMPQE
PCQDTKGKKNWLTIAKQEDMSSKSCTELEKEVRDQPMKRRPTSSKSTLASSKCVIGKQPEVSIGEKMVLGMMQKESTSTHNVVLHDELLLTNGFKEDIRLKNEP